MSVTAPDGSVWPTGSLRALEHQSIRSFVGYAGANGYLKGRVLDYGCGTAPYKALVEAAGGEWFGYDRAEFPDNHVGDVGPGEVLYPYEEWDAILCTQVVQYLPIARNAGYAEHWPIILYGWRESLKIDGHLILTYPTNWPETQPEDLHRFTKAGMERLLTEAGFTIIRHERRAEIKWDVDTFALGYGCIARA